MAEIGLHRIFWSDRAGLYIFRVNIITAPYTDGMSKPQYALRKNGRGGYSAASFLQ
jgi:hypothetical protein